MARTYHPLDGEEHTLSPEREQGDDNTRVNHVQSQDFRPVTGSQLRAARALVRWSVDDLAEISRVAVATISHAEAQDGPVSMTAADARALRRALEGAGVEFIAENDGGVGVRLSKRSGRPDEGLRPDQLTSENDG
jgi:transcriptional regulator with XRE-family HTH domain